MKPKRAVLWLVLCCFVVAFMVGCGGQQSAKPADPAVPADSADEKEGGKLVWGNPYGPTTFDPVFCNEEGGVNVIDQVFDALYARDGENNIIPELALSHENPDDLTWIFHLREDAMWHDGNEVFEEGKARAVTAEDVKYTFDRMLDPETNSPRIGLIPLVSGVEVIDDLTVKITTQEPDAFLIENLPSVYIIPKEAVEQMGAEKFGRNPIGSGPFKFVEFVPDSHVKLERFEGYYNKPYLEEIFMKVIPDQNVLLVALESGDVQANRLLPSPEVPRIANDPKYKAYPGPTYTYRYAGYNCNHPLFEDPKMRRALSLALDLDSALAAIFPEGVAIRAYGPVPKGIVGWDDDLKDLWQGGPDVAIAALAELGWTPGSDGIMQKDGKKLEFGIKVGTNDPNRLRYAVIMGEQWKEIGVKAEVQQIEWGTLVSDVSSGNTEVYVLGGYSGASGMGFLFHTDRPGAGGNSSFYSNKQVDALIDKASATLDIAEREVVWKEAQRMLVGEYAHIPLYHEAMYCAVAANVNDFTPMFGFVTSELNTWLSSN